MWMHVLWSKRLVGVVPQHVQLEQAGQVLYKTLAPAEDKKVGADEKSGG